MKILVINNSSIDLKNNNFYTDSFNGKFLSELIEFGHKVSYFQFVTHSDESTLKNFDLENAGIKCLPVKYHRNKLYAYILAYIKLAKIVSNYDFVYLFYPTSFKCGAFICKLFRIKYGLYIRGINGMKGKVAEWIFKNASTIFTVSKHFSDMIDGRKNSNKCNTIRPMIPYSNNDIIWNREYDKNKKVFEILFLARFDREKGISELLHALKILKEKQYKFHCNFIGDGEYMPAAKQIIEDLSINDIVRLKGAVYDPEEKKQSFIDNDIYVLPTYHEGFPRTLYEAMIFGTPIVTTFVGGIPALMIDQRNCIRIEPKSVESIVDGLEYAMNNYDRMIELANAAKQNVDKIVDSNRLTHAQHLSQIINSYAK